jgi:alkanesulfonate monooxygenase SsuD/methylene tetrahydromethanopterin reductase-like flavin-dependent oxidoreductase (luciferase family)
MNVGLFLQPAHPAGQPLRKGYDWDLQMIRWADELGYNEVFVGQHFTMPWEPLPAPDLLMSAAFEQTEQIVISAGVHNLPFHNPVELAYRLAFLDHIAQGRLIAGVGSGGTPSDWQLFNVDGRSGQTSRMMWEALDLMTRLWTESEPFEFRGEFWSANFPGMAKDGGLGAHIRCFQDPHPRIAIGGASPRSSTLRQAVALGHIPISLALNTSILAGHGEMIDLGAADAGNSPDRSDWRVVQHVLIADSDAEARKLAREGNMARGFQEFFLPHVYGSPSRLAMIKHDESVADDDVTVEYLMDHHWLVGSPDTVVERLREVMEVTGGFGTLLAGTYDYSDQPEAYRRSLELLVSEVAPRLAVGATHGR